MLHSMLKPLAEAGHDVSVVVTQEGIGRKKTIDGISVYRPGNPAEKIAELNPAVIVSHHDEMRRAFFLSHALDASFALILHNDFMAPMWSAAQMRPDLLVFNTDWVQKSFTTQFGQPARSLVVHPPVDGEAHRTVPGSKVTLVNLNRDKGGEIFYLLAEQMPDIEFLGVVGGHGEQIIRRDLPNVEIFEHTSNMKEVWSKTRTLLMPSIYESYGLVSIEAAHSGIPTIAHPTPGLREALGRAGIFYDRDNLASWREWIGRLSTDEWDHHSSNAQRRAESLNPDPELDAWVQAIEGLETK